MVVTVCPAPAEPDFAVPSEFPMTPPTGFTRWATSRPAGVGWTGPVGVVPMIPPGGNGRGPATAAGPYAVGSKPGSGTGRMGGSGPAGMGGAGGSTEG